MGQYVGLLWLIPLGFFAGAYGTLIFAVATVPGAIGGALATTAIDRAQFNLGFWTDFSRCRDFPGSESRKNKCDNDSAGCRRQKRQKVELLHHPGRRMPEYSIWFRLEFSRDRWWLSLRSDSGLPAGLSRPYGYRDVAVRFDHHFLHRDRYAYRWRLLSTRYSPHPHAIDRRNSRSAARSVIRSAHPR